MFADYHKENSVFADSIRKFCEKHINHKIADWEKDHTYPDEIFELLGQEGFLGLLIPEEYGGVGEDYKFAATWCEIFGEVPSVGFSIAVNMHSLVISYALANLASEEVKNKFLSDAVAGKSIGAYAFTEPNAGSDLMSITTNAKKEGEKWVLNGAKTFITNGARAGFVLVLTKTAAEDGTKGFTTFAVDTSLPGFKVSRTLDKLGWHCSDTAEMVFEDVELDDSCILGKQGEGWYLAMNSLNWERLMLTLSTLGSIKKCFKDTWQYAEERKAFGKAIVELDIIKSYLKEMYRVIRVSETLTYDALDEFLTGADCRLSVALAKKYVCENAPFIADKAIQIHGGYGYTQEFLPERWWRDLRLMNIGGGTGEIMGNIAAKELF